MDLKELVKTIQSAAVHQVVDDNSDLLFVPAKDDIEASIIDLEKNRSNPRYLRGSRTVYDVRSFNKLMADFCTPSSRIYVDKTTQIPSIECVFNDGHVSMPEWRNFRVSLQMIRSPEFLAWHKIDGKLSSQADFAEFIEDNANDIIDPVAAQMLEIATQLSATKSTAFRSAIRLSNGQIQFQNVENLEAKVGAGHIDVPEIITLGLPIFLGTSPFKLKARFRYRISEGTLTMGVKLERLTDVLSALLDEVVAQIEPPEGVPVIFGQAGPIPSL